nr:MAG TPA: hypothetical protein [Caudoviricetes sp.]
MHGLLIFLQYSVPMWYYIYSYTKEECNYE